jgi:hypothetical protein
MRPVILAFLVCLAACSAGPSNPSAPSSPSPTSPPSPAEGPLAGRWVGLAAEDMGLITTDRTREDFCTNRYDFEGTLSHQGTKLTGTMTSRFVGADCLAGGIAYHIPPSAFQEKPVTHFLTLVVTPSGGVSVPWDDWVGAVGGAAGELNQDLAGNYTANTISLGGERTSGRSSWSVTFGLRRQ